MHHNKPIKNPLLQTANYGFPLDSLLSKPLVVPISDAETSFPTGTETNELDSFIGQDNNSPNSPCATSSTLRENTDTVEHSVPLIVPPPASSSLPLLDPPLTQYYTTPVSTAVSNISSSSFNSTFANSDQIRFFTSASTIPSTTLPSSSENRSTVAGSSFLYSEQSKPKFTSFESPLTPNVIDNPVNRIPSPPTNTLSNSSNSYRLGNLKRPAYAPVPGLSSSSSSSSSSSTFANTNQQNFPKFTISNPETPIFQPELNYVQNSSTMPVIGPYSSTTTSSSPNNPQIVAAEKVSMYRPVYHHWFYRKDVEKNRFSGRDPEIKSMWKPFSMADSLALEQAYSLPTLNEETIVATDGGRYDVNVKKREKIAVYWEERKSIVRRCSWFSKAPTDNLFVPYDEDVAAKLEEEYKLGMISGIWNRKVDIGNEEVIMHGVSLFTHQMKSTSFILEVANDSSIRAKPMRRRSYVKKWIRRSCESQWAQLHQPSQLKPRIVKRGGFDDFDIDDGEPEKIDHLVFLIHGIGQFCDLKFRSVVEVVDEFRALSLQLAQSHFQESCELGEVNRIEILPVSWHKALHCEDTGVDKRLKNITLPSIPRLRDFSNDTILDVLFYTSPVFCQVIVNAVVSEINRLQDLFIKRNPDFCGKLSVGGHSLGSLILFDILSNQPSATSEPTPDIAEDLAEEFDKRLSTSTRKISVVTIGKSGTGQPLVKYPRLNFHPRFFFAFGSPIACFIATRSNEILGENFEFPTCKGFFNIFHPYDPIAYRIEPLVIPSLSNVKPVQVPHHKGRKRMHLELKDTVSHVGQRLIDTVKNTWNMVYHLAVNKSVDAAESVIQHEITQVLHSTDVLTNKPINPNVVPNEPSSSATNVKVGCLNEGKRVDYVLQETPVEYFNEYLFALASHLCYWTSRDTILLVLKEVYGDMGICTDHQVPQTILPFDITEKEDSNINSPTLQTVSITDLNPSYITKENMK